MRKVICLMLICLLLASLSLPVFAEEFTGKDGWNVTFNGKEISSTFKTKDIDDLILGMQPGDEVKLDLVVQNTGKDTVNWYMANDVLKSLEDSQKVANGGNYTYDLRYTNSKKENVVIYSSNRVGGETTSDVIGLHQATGSLKDFFFLDEMGANGTGHIYLTVKLDGETLGNSYQDTLASLEMKFAVEVRTKSTNPPPVYTGDDRNVIPYVAAFGISGLVLLVLAVISLRSRRKEKKVTEE